MFTMQNTEGFNETEIATLNAVRELALDERPDIAEDHDAESHLDDVINNAWLDGSEPFAQFAARVFSRLHIGTQEIASKARRDLVDCLTGDGWSLHAPGSTDEEIATGEAPYLACGQGRPNDHDYAEAWFVNAARQRRIGK